jgi:hypothetical protein
MVSTPISQPINVIKDNRKCSPFGLFNKNSLSLSLERKNEEMKKKKKKKKKNANE